MVGFAEFIIGPAKGRTRWLNPPYDRRAAYRGAPTSASEIAGT
jgi:hypothetical protein